MGTPTLRTNALTTLEALKQLLGIDETDTSQDSVLIQLINRASASIENALGRKLRRSTYTERVKGTGSQYLLVENYPIVAVEEIKQAGEIIDPGLYDITVRGNAGVIYKDDGWTYYGFPHGLTGDAVTGSRNITVRYTAGYILPWEATDEAPADLPADEAILAVVQKKSALDVARAFALHVRPQRDRQILGVPRVNRCAELMHGGYAKQFAVGAAQDADMYFSPCQPRQLCLRALVPWCPVVAGPYNRTHSHTRLY